MERRSRYPTELRERAVRMVIDHRDEYESEWAAMRSIAEMLAQRLCVGVFRPGGARPPTAVMLAFIDHHREVYGVEPICRVL